MSAQQQPKRTRRVVTGVNAQGRSVIVSDTPTPTWVQRPTGSLIMEIWRAASLPAQLTDEPAEDLDPIIGPPASGLSVRIAVFPPDRDIDEQGAAEYEAAMDELYGDQAYPSPPAVPGMHRTDTIDIVTVLDGELTIILEDGETLLRTGDCLVQRGTRHAWLNRSDRPCTVSSTMLVAVRRD